MTGNMGTLIVELPADSWILRDHLPFEIRDEKYALVTHAQADRPIDLPEGLYAVSLVLDTGERVTRPALIKRGQRTVVSPASSNCGSQRVSPLLVPADELEPTVLRALFQRPPPVEPAGEPCWIADLAPNLAVLHDPERRQIGVRLDAPDANPAWIVLASERAALQLMLPLSDHHECRDCTIDLHPSRATGQLRVSVTLPPRRRGRALLALMATGKVDLALAVAKAACERLASEHADPVCAVYGALLLERCEPPAQRPPWIEPLMNECAWLSDAKILHAALLSRSSEPDERRLGHALLLETTRTPSMLFADSFSLAIKLLRRWPIADAGSDERRARLSALAGTSARLAFEHAFTSVAWTRVELDALSDTDRRAEVPARPPRDREMLRRQRWPSGTQGPFEGWPLASEVIAGEVEAEFEAVRQGSAPMRAVALPPQPPAEHEAQWRLVEAYEQGVEAFGA
jgi:hypothetical protein